MILSAHIVMGSAIGAYTGNIPLIALFSIIAHLTMDAIPHWEYEIKHMNTVWEWSKVCIDISAGFIISYLFFRQINIAIMTGIFFSVLIDGFEFLYIKWKFRWALPIVKLHHKIHFKKIKKLR